jgi:hypothetical protein
MFECSPVSTNVMRQSSRSRESSSIALAALGEHEVVGQALVVVEEVLADHVAAIAEARMKSLWP